MAETCDELVNRGILDEAVEDKPVREYKYRLTDRGRDALLQSRQRNKPLYESIDRFAPLADRLAEKQPRDLELAATYLFFRYTHQRDEALRKTSELKGVTDSELMLAKVQSIVDEVVPYT